MTRETNLGLFVSLIGFLAVVAMAVNHFTPPQATSNLSHSPTAAVAPKPPEPPKDIGNANLPEKTWEWIRMWAPIIRSRELVCDEISGARDYGPSERGRVIWVLCNHDSLSYKVILTPSHNLLISPW